jgi:two-component system sensor histidine kinase KdpD
MNSHWGRYAWALAITGACTAAAWLMHPHFEPANLIMVYLLGVTIAGLKLGRGPSVLTSVLSVAAFDFFFVHPHFNFAVSDVQYLLTFAVMLLVALTIANLTAIARERAQLAKAAEEARLSAERETLRSTLLASISHDLRTPLSVIAGAASTLARHGVALDENTRGELARSIDVKAQEMSELVSNVLDLVRLESGDVRLRRDWQTVDDLVSTALRRMQSRLDKHPVDLAIPSDLPPVHVDATLMVQVFCNLLDNIVKYTPPGTRARISALAEDSFVLVAVCDDGPGLPPGDAQRLFEKFHRGQDEGRAMGVGLGLAICRAVLRAHGGEIVAMRGAVRGACFDFKLPATEARQ